MQTFLPEADFGATARLLDSRRLGKQRVEALQILRALTRPEYGWKSHPAVRMWSGHEEALVAYGLAMCEEWCRRGYRDTVAATLVAEFEAAGGDLPVRTQEALARCGRLPTWLADEDFHRSHRSALLRKDAAHYALLFPGERDDLPYVWPTHRSTPADRPPRQEG